MDEEAVTAQIDATWMQKKIRTNCTHERRPRWRLNVASST